MDVKKPVISTGMLQRWQEWMQDRPPQVQELAARFPHGTVLRHAGQVLYLVGYYEGKAGAAGLWLSPVNPFEDYRGAVAARLPVEGACLADAEVL